MILLALDASSPSESAALFADGRLLDQRTWPGDRHHARPLFDALRAMLADNGVAPERIEVYAVGLGPGSFAGLRMALACLHGMALPGERTLYGLSSAEAASSQAARLTGRDAVLVCGDGRRQRLWSGLFRLRDGLPVQDGEFRLDPADAMAERMPAGGAVCTADWPLLAAPLKAAAATAGSRLIEAPVHPSAAVVGELAIERMRRGIPTLPPVPLYLHPPVFVPPSFVEPSNQEIR